MSLVENTESPGAVAARNDTSCLSSIPPPSSPCDDSAPFRLQPQTFCRNPSDVAQDIREFFSNNGKKGGRARGAVKRRSAAHYKRISALAVAAKKAKALARKEAV